VTSPAERYRTLLAARPTLARNLPGGIDVVTDAGQLQVRRMLDALIRAESPYSEISKL